MKIGSTGSTTMAFAKFLRTYFGETPIHGFGFIANASSNITVYFWAVIILVAAGLCVNDFITLVSFYKTVPTMVSIEVHRKAEFDEPPVPVLCMELNHFYLKAPNKVSANNLTGIYVPLLLQNTKNLTDLGTLPFSHSLSYHSNKLMPYDLFYYTFVMLGHMASFEILVSEHKYITDYWDMFDVAQTPNFYKNNSSSLVEQLFQTYKSHNVSFDKLSRLVGAILCGIYINEAADSYVNIESDTYLNRICSPEAITHLSLGLLCVQIGNSSLWSTPNFDLQIGTVQSGAIVDICDISPFDVSDNLLWHLDFQGRPVYGSSDSLNVHNFRPPVWTIVTMSAPFGSLGTHHSGMEDFSTYPLYFSDEYQINYGPEIPTLLSLSVLISDHYKFYNKQSKPCSTAKQRFNAVLEQRAEYFYRKCGCWPTQLYLSNNWTNDQSAASCSQRYASVRPVPRDKSALETGSSVWNLDKTVYQNLDQVNIGVSYALQNHMILFTNANNVTAYPYWQECTGINETFTLVEECEMIAFSVTESTIRSSNSKQSFVRIEVRNEVYNVILESPYKNWSTFVSELGGSIGVWLGKQSVTAKTELTLLLVSWVLEL